nr:hypothetical protein [Cryobacterium sp. TMT1-3]
MSVRQKPLLRLGDFGQFKALSRIGCEATIIDGELQGTRKHVDDLSDRCRPLYNAEPARPLLDLKPLEVSQGDAPQLGNNVIANRAVYAIKSGWAQVRAAGQPSGCPVGHRDSGAAGIDVSASVFGDLNGCKKQISVASGSKTSLVRL